MNDINKPFFSEPTTPQEGDLSVWLEAFHIAWEREFYGTLKSFEGIISNDEELKVILKNIESKAKKARDEIAHIIHLGETS